MSDPALSLTYKCTIDGIISLGTWTKIEGLGYAYDVTEYREGGVNGYIHKIVGPLKYENVRLSRPVDSDSEMIGLWLAANLIKIIPQTMSISALDSKGDEVTQWNLVNVVPVKWSGPSLAAGTSAVAIEKLEIAHERLTLSLSPGKVLAGVAGALGL